MVELFGETYSRRDVARHAGMLSQLTLRVIVLLFLCPRSGAAAKFTFFEPVKPPRPQQVMAHRGESRQWLAGVQSVRRHD